MSAFAGAYEWLGGFLDTGKGPEGQTLPQRVPEWIVLAALIAASIAVTRRPAVDRISRIGRFDRGKFLFIM